MRKIVSMLLCLALAGMVCLGTARRADAADTAHMSLESSAGTLYRGDSFTLTVGLSNDRSVGSGGVILSYDSSVFEFVEGSCHVDGTALAEVSPAHNGGVFVLQTDRVVSGTVFTIRMRVKESAPFGSHTISGSPSLDGISCTIDSISVSVDCSHTYGSPARTDGDHHVRTCTVCGQQETEAHTWGGFTLVQASTCRDPGLKRLTCIDCGAARDEVVPAHNDHRYGPWTGTDDGCHSRVCTVCGRQEAGDHTWDGGTVTVPAACQQEGQREFRCTACDAARTEHIPAADHDYGGWVYDEDRHFRRCGLCGGETEQAAHSIADSGCTVCGYVMAPAATEPAPEATAPDSGHNGTDAERPAPASDDSFPWQILWAAAACGILAGGYLLLKKRRAR